MKVITCALTLISITFSKINIFQFCKKYVIGNKILNKISSNNIFGDIFFVPKSGGKVGKREKISRSRSVEAKKKSVKLIYMRTIIYRWKANKLDFHVK